MTMRTRGAVSRGLGVVGRKVDGEEDFTEGVADGVSDPFAIDAAAINGAPSLIGRTSMLWKIVAASYAPIPKERSSGIRHMSGRLKPEPSVLSSANSLSSR